MKKMKRIDNVEKFLTEEDCDGLYMTIVYHKKEKGIDKKDYFDYKDFDRVFNTTPKGNKIEKGMYTSLHIKFDKNSNLFETFLLGRKITEKGLKNYKEFMKRAFKILRENKEAKLNQIRSNIEIIVRRKDFKYEK